MVPLALLAATPVRYVPFGNARYGFFLDRPTFLTPLRPPDNGDGQAFRSGAIVLRAYGAMNVDGSTASILLQRARNEAKGGTISLAVAKEGWYALSYTKTGIVHYEKTFVNKETTRHLEFEYPKEESKRMAPVVSHVVRSFHPTPSTPKYS